MPFYVRLGQLPHKRHTQFRKPDGGLYREQVMGVKGFSGIQSILYHINPPTAVREVKDLPLHRRARRPRPLAWSKRAPDLRTLDRPRPALAPDVTRLVAPLSA